MSPMILPDHIPSNVTEILIVRHGETTWNAAGRLQGQLESDLSTMGKCQAAAVGEKLAAGDVPFSAIYSSDLRRAYDTAKEIAFRARMEIIRDIGLRERHVGVLQGLTIPEARRLQPEAYKAFTSHRTDASIEGGGESIDALHERVVTALETIAKKHRGERIVVVCHGGVIHALHEYATGLPPKVPTVNTSINVMRINSDNDWKVGSWGNIKHLDRVGFHAQAFGGDAETA